MSKDITWSRVLKRTTIVGGRLDFYDRDTGEHFHGKIKSIRRRDKLIEIELEQTYLQTAEGDRPWASSSFATSATPAQDEGKIICYDPYLGRWVITPRPRKTRQ